MAKTRTVILALALAAVVWALILIQPQPGAHESGAFEAWVTSPNQTHFNGTVEAENATAYSVLLGAAQLGKFTVDATGQGCTTYVHAVAGIEAAGVGGWVYKLHRDGTWTYPTASAGCFALQKGDIVWWHWTDRDVG